MLRCQNMLSRTWMSAVSSSRRDIAINRNIKERSITRSSCGTPLRLKIRSSIPLNRTLLDQIQNAKSRSEALRRYPGSFAETLVALQKERKLSNKQLADHSLVGEKTIQRLRNDEEYPTSVQTVLALCVGLKLPLPEAEMFLGKTDFKLNSMKGEGYVYQCVLGACAENSIYEINEMLKENGITPLGSDPDLQ